MTLLFSKSFSALLMMVMFAVPAFSQEAGKPPDAVVVNGDSAAVKNPKGAMLRSLAVPGWGQFYNGKWFKGILVAGTEIGLVANAAIMNQWAKEAVDENERFYYTDSRNLSYWLLAAAILYSVVDAYVDAQLYDFDESPNLSIQFIPNRERFTFLNKTWSVCLSLSL
jgi:hypothetical protein